MNVDELPLMKYKLVEAERVIVWLLSVHAVVPTSRRWSGECQPCL